MTNSIEDILALMNKSVEELANDVGLTVEQASHEVIRIEKKHQVSQVMGNNPVYMTDDFIELIKQAKLH